MTVLETVEVLTAQLFQQGDERDPLGIWGARKAIVGNTDADSLVGVTVIVPAAIKAAYVFAVYGLNLNIISTPTLGLPFQAKVRLLTNWPNIDPDAGVQGFSTFRLYDMDGSFNFTAPISTVNTPLLEVNDRFMLLYDPRSQGTAPLSIIEMFIQDNTNTAVYAFEAYGYFWDRSVIQAPGGPRHPGAS